MATADVLSAHESHLEKLVRECSTRVGVREDTDWSKCSQTPCGCQWKRTSLAVKRAPSEVTGFDDSTQHSQGAIELEWDLAEKIIRFVAHVVPGNSGLLLSRSDLNDGRNEL